MKDFLQLAVDEFEVEEKVFLLLEAIFGGLGRIGRAGVFPAEAGAFAREEVGVAPIHGVGVGEE